MSLENKFNDFKTKHDLDDDAIAEILKIFNESFIELAHKLLNTEVKEVKKIEKTEYKKWATKIAAEHAAEHGLSLDDFDKEKITKKDIDELVKQRVKTVPKLKTEKREIKVKCHGLTKNGEPCGKPGTETPEGSKNCFCFRHAMDWKTYEVSSDSDEELHQEPIISN